MSINHFLSTAFGIAGSEKYTLGPPIFFSYFQKKKHSKWLTNFNKNGGDKKVRKKFFQINLFYPCIKRV